MSHIQHLIYGAFGFTCDCMNKCVDRQTDRQSNFNGLNSIVREDPVLRKIRESKWIRALETSCPKGMNLRVDSL